MYYIPWGYIRSKLVIVELVETALQCVQTSNESLRECVRLLQGVKASAALPEERTRWFGGPQR